MRFYADSGPEKDMYTQVGAHYFEKAIACFPKDVLFIVFSNQIDRCKKELAHIKRTLYFVEGEDYIHDFYLMSLCKHNIICNSSFSWWAAYLNPHPNKKIIAPHPWFTSTCYSNSKDLIPPEWTVISVED